MVRPILQSLIVYSPVVLAAIQGTESTLSRHVRTEYRTWGKRLVDNDNVIGNWPGKAATATIPIRSKTIGDSLADDYRAILLAILEENEAQRLYVRKRPKGMHIHLCFRIAILMYILTQGADWLIQRVDGECVLRSEYRPEHTTLQNSAPPQSPTVSISLSVRTGRLCLFYLTSLSASSARRQACSSEAEGPFKISICDPPSERHDRPYTLRPPIYQRGLQ